MARIVNTYAVPSRGIGGPDYAAPKPIGQFPIGPVHTLTDIAELAARLKSANTFDRRGNVILLDDFEDTLKWRTSFPGGAGGVIALSSEAARSGAFSCKMTCPDIGYALIERYLGYPVLSNMGFEISFTIPAWPDDASLLVFGLVLDDGTDWMVAEVLWDMSDPDHRNHTLSIGVPAPIIYEEFDKDFYNYYASPYLDSPCFHTAKLVVDFVNRRYLRFILDHVTYDLSRYNISIITGGAVSVGVHMSPSFRIENNVAGTNPFCYVDDAIITQNEPANPVS